jgi:ABC-type multidrug transport system ATPase subunit
MIVEIPSYKYIDVSQEIDLSTIKISTLIGENGSGKSTLLESVFKNYTGKIISFSSGQNELFTNIYNEIKRNTFKKFQSINTDSEEIKKYHFDYDYSRVLIFIALSLKNGIVRKYLIENQYINSSLSNTSLNIEFELPEYYLTAYNDARKKEEKEPEHNSIIKTYIHKYIERIIEKKIHSEYDFDKVIKKNNLTLTSDDLLSIFDEKDSWKIFTFISLTNNSAIPIFNYRNSKLLIKNDLEFQQLSDGEYQLLSIYALIDLFDEVDTVFLLDEVDSHLHFNNISKLWNILKTISGKVITTTHISESILNNDFNSISYIEKGKIVNNLVPKKVLEKISNVVNQEKFIYQICSKLENIVLIDDESDWEIFKELAKIKIGEEAITFLKDIVAIKETSSYNSDFQLFGNEKIEFTKNIKAYSVDNTINLKNIFMICDLDEYQITNINPNHQCLITEKLKPYIDKIQKFNHNQTKAYLLSWKRREILHYMISYSMLKEYNKLEELKNIATYINGEEYINNNFDNDSNIKTTSKANVKFIKQLMSKENGDVDADNWTDYDKLKQIIDKIPASEISEDIKTMYEFIKSKVENS